MKWRSEYNKLLWIAGFFIFAYYLPIENEQFRQAIFESLALAKWYAREHVLLCLVPAFFIAGVIAVFVSQAAVVKYFGSSAPRFLSYTVASISGAILAVCSCTVLPLFSGIHKRGAGLGPAIAFLYSGPAINILAIILTARVLGLELGIARVVGAVMFSIIIGLAMHWIYREEESARAATQFALPQSEETRPLWQTAIHLFVLVAMLVFVNWGKPDTGNGAWQFIYAYKWHITGIMGLLFGLSLVYILKIRPVNVILGAIPVVVLAILFPHHPLLSFSVAIISLCIIIAATPGEPRAWLQSTWDFTKQIMPLLGAGVLVAGFLLGSPDGGHGLIPGHWISSAVGGNSLLSNLLASVVGAFMYFATLTEVPILQGLISGGMGKGPALALLLAGPALSLPNMLVIRSVIGTQKTVVFVSLVVVMATLSGLIYGSIF